jgi:LacI family gluconate utilization system Gnt-I transcriptional repressor
MVIADDQRSLIRRGGFMAAAKDHGLGPPLEIQVHAPTKLGTGREAFAQLCDRGEPFDALFCTSDQLAMGALYEAQHRGIPVPDQVSVVGFGNLAGAAYTTPSLTTVAVDGARMGREAARMIVERLNGAAAPASAPEDRIVDVGLQVIARESA